MDLGLGADIDALRRLFEQQHVNPAREPFGQNDLLLIATRERADRKLRPARPDVEEVHELGDDTPACGAVDERTAGQTIKACQQDVVAHGLIEHQAERALSRHKTDPCRNRIRRTAQPARLRSHQNR